MNRSCTPSTLSNWTPTVTMPLWVVTALVLLASYVDVCEATSRRVKFKAAVYEHAVIVPEDGERVVSREQALELMRQNLNVYAQQATEASGQGVDILVFPENGLYGQLGDSRDHAMPYMEYLPDPKVDYWIPCDDPSRFPNTEVQMDLSCMAKNNHLYIVANMGNCLPCHKDIMIGCPSEGRLLYNTNVVFDPHGLLIARYHKNNVSEEEPFSTPVNLVHDVVAFHTPFGSWGLLTGVDILFMEPAVTNAEWHGLANMVYTTAWKDSPPLMSSVGVQSAFARRMGVNLLAANVHVSGEGLCGSGIYTPTGTEAYYYNASIFSGPQLIVAELHTLEKPVPESNFNGTTHSAQGSKPSSFGNVRKAFGKKGHHARGRHDPKSTIVGGAKELLGDEVRNTFEQRVSGLSINDVFSQPRPHLHVSGHNARSSFQRRGYESNKQIVENIFQPDLYSDEYDDVSEELTIEETIEVKKTSRLNLDTDGSKESAYSEEVAMRISDKVFLNGGRSHGVPETETAFVSFLFDDLYNFVLLDREAGTVHTCSNELCCELTYSLTSSPGSQDLFALGAFAGKHTTGQKLYLQVCALVRCADQSLTSCGSPTTQSETFFNYLRMSGSFTSNYVFPEVLLSTDNNHLQVPGAKEWRFSGKTIESHQGFGKPLAVAAMYGRVYSKDRTVKIAAFYPAQGNHGTVPHDTFNWTLCVFLSLMAVRIL